MPTPFPGDGGLTFNFGQILPVGTLYLAAFNPVTPVAPPGINLGVDEPAAAWVKTGLLRDEQFTVEEADPDIIEYRRGFRQRYFGEVIRKAGVRTVTAKMDEIDPASIASFTGAVTTALGSANAIRVDLGSSEYYHRSLLAVYYDDVSSAEFQMYSPHVLARYKMSKNAEFMTVDLTIKLISFINASNLYKDIRYYYFGGASGQNALALA
jgi:hypothetical protein